ncbi:MAG: DUF861 domain-containing protein [Candidatus Dadabacteria bacterium]|nr:MAG: DUF861 domain-containing protein [Candidatus Dadabacteria bacterium]
MSGIRIEHHLDRNRLDELGVEGWPIWSCEVSTFPWTYDETETCYMRPLHIMTDQF